MICDIRQILTCGRLSPCSRTWWCAWTRSPFQEIQLRPFLAAASPPATNALQTAPTGQTWASRGHSETQTVTNYKQSQILPPGKTSAVQTRSLDSVSVETDNHNCWMNEWKICEYLMNERLFVDCTDLACQNIVVLKRESSHFHFSACLLYVTSSCWSNLWFNW